MTYYRLHGGQVHDPRNQVDGAIQDIWIHQGRIVPAPQDMATAEIVTLDITGDVVMPGGVDMHCHIAGPKVNHARGFLGGMQGQRQGRKASASGASIVPNCRATGQLFAGMGYTTAVDAAIPGISARLAHHEFGMTPFIDKAFLTLF